MTVTSLLAAENTSENWAIIESTIMNNIHTNDRQTDTHTKMHTSTHDWTQSHISKIKHIPVHEYVHALTVSQNHTYADTTIHTYRHNWLHACVHNHTQETDITMQQKNKQTHTHTIDTCTHKHTTHTCSHIHTLYIYTRTHKTVNKCTHTTKLIISSNIISARGGCPTLAIQPFLRKACHLMEKHILLSRRRLNTLGSVG